MSQNTATKKATLLKLAPGLSELDGLVPSEFALRMLDGVTFQNSAQNLLANLGELVNPFPCSAGISGLQANFDRYIDNEKNVFLDEFKDDLYIEQAKADHAHGIFENLKTFDLRKHMEATNLFGSKQGIFCKSSMSRLKAMHRSQKAVAIIMHKVRSITTIEEARIYVFILGSIGIDLPGIIDPTEKYCFVEL